MLLCFIVPKTKGKKMKRKIIFCCAVIFMGLHVGATNPPKPLAGYSWVQSKDKKIAFLRPNGWFLRRTGKGAVETMCVSVEDSKKNGGFTTGFTLNIIKNVKKKFHKTPSEFAVAFIKDTTSKHKTLKKWNHNQGLLKGFGCRIKSKEKGDIAMVYHYHLVANDKTGTLFICFFEAPEKSWDTAWKKGEKLMKYLWLDDEV